MRQLILVRHAKAVPAGGPIADFDRPLADQGRIDAPVMARGMAAAGASPQLALVSTAKRCRETWAAMEGAFAGVETRFVDDFYDAAAETLLEEAEASGVERVLVLAHNPGLHELAARFAHRNAPLDQQLRAKLPPAGSALFERKDETSSWKLIAYLMPERS
jgi:phosphohistidine phosphatase